MLIANPVATAPGTDLLQANFRPLRQSLWHSEQFPESETGKGHGTADR